MTKALYFCGKKRIWSTLKRSSASNATVLPTVTVSGAAGRCERRSAFAQMILPAEREGSSSTALTNSLRATSERPLSCGKRRTVSSCTATASSESRESVMKMSVELRRKVSHRVEPNALLRIAERYLENLACAALFSSQWKKAALVVELNSRHPRANLWKSCHESVVFLSHFSG